MTTGADQADRRVVRLGEEIVAEGAAVADLGPEAERKVSSWLAALLQVEHVSLLVGNGLSLAIGHPIGVLPPQMTQRLDAGEYTERLAVHAAAGARAAGRGEANLEDEIRSALALMDGLAVLGEGSASDAVRAGVDAAMQTMIREVLAFERAVHSKYRAGDADMLAQAVLLQRFLFPFAARAAGRDRLHLFTTNYDRLLEFAGDLLGLRLIDRFVGALRPTFSASRLDLDMHYSPPGIRGEPRLLEGVVRYAKLHGSVDWRHDEHAVVKVPLAFGAREDDPHVPARPSDTTVIYPNPAKDVETLAYPYAEMFRDFAASICRPNSVLVTFGYGFGDTHLNRVVADMLTLPSTHLVVISRDPLDTIDTFRRARPVPRSQTTELIGAEVGSLDAFVDLVPSAMSAELLEAQAEHAERSFRLRRATASDASEDLAAGGAYLLTVISSRPGQGFGSGGRRVAH